VEVTLAVFFYLRFTMTEKILILDFGSQYTQLIARAVREANVYCEIIPYHKPVEFDPSLKGIILSGSPFTVNDPGAPVVDVAALHARVPVLGICYGAQLTAKLYGGSVEKSNKREYGRALMHKREDDVLLREVIELSQVWMSHADTILELPSIRRSIIRSKGRRSSGISWSGSAAARRTGPRHILCRTQWRR
jgi:GMP synthase (glutamine-hydrolysing)